MNRVCQMTDQYLQEVARIASELDRQEIEKVLNILYEAWEKDRTIFIMGNGGSASTASHFVCDLNKWTIVEGKKRFRVVGLVDNVPWVSALTNDNGFESIYVEQLMNLAKPGDVVIGLSVHGGSGKDKAGPWSQNLLKAMRYIQQNGGKAIGMSGFDGGPMKEIADACIVVPIHSTLLVESFHLTLEHLICDCLRERIARPVQPTKENKHATVS